MARQFIYHMQGMSKSYSGGKKVLENIHLSFYPDAKIGVLGPNGAGKSTLLRIMAGIDKEFSGEAWLADGATSGYLPQEPQLDETKDVMGNVMEGVSEKQAILDRYNELAMNYSDETADEMTRLQDEIDAQNLWDLDSQVEQAMDALRCPPGDADVSKLSGGERRRVALTQLLLRKPDLLLLDEPTNHLDAESVNWLEHHLREYPGAILIITHDRYFLDNERAGFWNSTVVVVSPTKATIRPTWARRPNGMRRKAARTLPARRRWKPNRSGLPPHPRPGRPSPRRVSGHMMNWSRQMIIGSSQPRPRSSFHQVTGLVMLSSTLKASRRAMVTVC